MIGLDLHAIAALVSERILGSLAAGTLLALLVWAALRLMRSRNSRTRFALCFAALVAIAALPFAGMWESVSHAVPARANALLHLPQSWALYLFGAWALIATAGLARLGYGLFRLWQVSRDCREVMRDDVPLRVLNTVDGFQSIRRVALLVSDTVRVPAAIGLWKPAIVLPAWCLRDLSAEELHTVVLHELEHLRRYDDWTNLLERAVEAIFFFHPAVWWLENRLSLEREMACDDAVLAAVPDPKRYAKCLVTLAEKSFLRHGIALAQAAVSRVQQLSARIAQILDVRRSRTTALWTPVFSVVVVAAAAGGASMGVMPRLISFQPESFAIAQSTVPSGAIDRGFLPVIENTSHNAQNVLHAVPARWIESAHKLSQAPKPKMNVASAANQNAGTVTAQASAAPQPLNATWRTPATMATPPHMLVMVVHTEEQDSAGNVWSVQVVRWVIFHPQPTRALDPSIPSKT